MDEPRDPESQREPLLPTARHLGDLRVAQIGIEELRTELGRTALEVAGEVGYQALTVDRIVDHGGASRSGFYRAFLNVDDCYLWGYKEVVQRLVEGLLERCADAPDWQHGVSNALDTLAEAIIAAPTLADGLIRQVRSTNLVAVHQAHAAASERLAAAIDRGRDVAPAGHTPPPIAGLFVFGAVEAVAAQALGRRRPEEFAAQVPDLNFLAVTTFLGADAARDPNC